MKLINENYCLVVHVWFMLYKCVCLCINYARSEKLNKLKTVENTIE